MSVPLDLRKLEEFDRMAVDGAAGATERLSGLTGVDAAVGYSRLNVVTPADVTEAIERDAAVAISISLEGYVDGAVVTVFDRPSARTLAESFMPMLPSDDGYTSKHESALEEICNVVVSGYVDGWANVEGESIVMAPPEIVSSAVADASDDRADGAGLDGVDGTENVVSQRSSITTPDDEVTFRMCLFLAESSTRRLFEAEDEAEAIENDTLTALREVVATETETVTENVGSLTGIEIAVDLETLDIVPAERLSESASDDRTIGSVIELRDAPYGYLLVLFDEPSASTIATAFDPKATEPSADGNDELTDRERSAIEEIGNVVASSIVDGWANHFEAGIEISTPAFVDDMRSSILNDAVVKLGPRERFVLNFKATVDATDVELECDIYTLIRPNDVPDGWCD